MFNMKNLNVVCAIIENSDKILIARRLKGELAGLWEFPGGKIEPNETNEQAIIREIREEFESDINVKKYLCTIEHEYPTFYLIMDCFICSLKDDNLHLHDHSAIQWINPFDDSIDYCPADKKVIKEYQKYIKCQAR